ncbi:MAG: hypothetical protein ACK2UB_14505 [Anaerolineales bacterium]
MRSKKFRSCWVCILFSCAIIFCRTGQALSPTIEPSATAQKTDTLTASPVPTGTKTITATRKIRPTSTPRPTSTQTRTFTVTNTPLPVSQQGPWLVLGTEDGLWAVNADGTGLRRIVDVPDEYMNQNILDNPTYINYEPAPRGGRLAFTLNDPQTGGYYSTEHFLENPPNLYILDFPDLSAVKITSLLDRDQVETLLAEKTEEELEWEMWKSLRTVEAAVTRPGSLAWSNGGRQLAFAAVKDGPSADVYHFDLGTLAITRLTSGDDTQAVNLSWSPDDRYVLHDAASFINIGSSGPMMESDGIWAASADGLDVHQFLSGDDFLIRWLSNDTLLAASYALYCGAYRLMKVNYLSAEQWIVWPEMFDTADADPETGVILVGSSIIEEIPEKFGCPPLAEAGMYILEGPYALPRRIGNFTVDSWLTPDYIYWSSILRKFLVQSSEGIVTVSTSGEVSDPITIGTSIDSILFSLPHISPSGRYWAIPPNRHAGVWVRMPDGEIIEVYDGLACNVTWRPDDGGFFFYGGDMPKTLYWAEAPDFQLREVASGMSLSCESYPRWVMP